MPPSQFHLKSRREFLQGAKNTLGGLALWSIGISPFRAFGQPPPDSIPVGVLHSLSGTMGSSGRTLVDAILMAIDEVNQQGGVLGRPLHPIIEDGTSDAKVFEEKARGLIQHQKVQTIFGCWTSTSRKAVLPIVEQTHNLLWYPVQYEGMEQSPNIMYGGATPNQQILPALQWGIERFGPRVFLLGSDYIFPRTANQLIKSRLGDHAGQLAGEAYQPLGSQEFQEILHAILNTRPDFIINTLNGDSNQGFFQQLHQAKISPQDIPVISVSIAEDELQHIGLEITSGHYAAWNYFQSIDTPSNNRFVSTFQQRYGNSRVTGDPIETAYIQVHLYALAASKAGTTNPEAIRETAANMIFGAPQGLIRIDPKNQHTWKVARVGRIQEDGQFSIVWSSQTPLKPEPFPT